MKIGFCGLGRMGMNMVARIQQNGHKVIAWNRSKGKRDALLQTGAQWVETHEDLIVSLEAPSAIWLMVPAETVDEMLAQILPLCSPGDIIIDGGNSRHHDTVRRAKECQAKGFEFIDVGTSGGVWGLQNGYCLMVGGSDTAVAKLSPIFDALTEPEGWLHCGSNGAGHFTKMVHNGIEYGMMQAYAEGFDILRASPYELNLEAVAHVWMQGSVVRSWLLELAEEALKKDPQLDTLGPVVAESGEGRWTVEDAISWKVPAPVIAMSLFTRYASQDENSFANRMLAALRREFGGHAVQEVKE